MAPWPGYHSLLPVEVSGSKFDTLLKGIDEIMNLPDPIGQVTYANQVSEGLLADWRTWSVLEIIERWDIMLHVFLFINCHNI